MLTEAQTKTKKDETVKPIDKVQSGEPQKVKTANGHKMVYKNKKGEVFKEESFNDLGAKLETKSIDSTYPNGSPAIVEIETFGEKDGKFGVKLSSEIRTLDTKGDVDHSVIYEEFDKDGIPDKKTEIEDGKKTEFERDSIFPGEWKEVLEKTKIEPPKLPEKKEAPSLGPITDPCVIGEWSTVQIKTYREDEPADNGAGVSIRFEPNGRMTIDYTGMKPLITYLYNPKRVSKTSRYVGRSVSYIRTHPGNFVDGGRVEELNVVLREEDDEGNVYERKMDGIFGDVAIGTGYVCSGNTLVWRHGQGERTTLKRKL